MAYAFIWLLIFGYAWRMTATTRDLGDRVSALEAEILRKG